jgi:hypothetical protein
MMIAIGIGIGGVALAATIVKVLLGRLWLPSDNDAWIFW